MKLTFYGITGSLLALLICAANCQAQSTDMDEVIAVALHGPESKKMKFINHEFIVRKAKITDRVTGITKIEGQIGHYRLFRPDEQFFYVIEKQHDRITRAEFQIERDRRLPHSSRLFQQSTKLSGKDLESIKAIEELKMSLDGRWECEAELIAFAVALRIDPLSHKDINESHKKSVAAIHHESSTLLQSPTEARFRKITKNQ